MFFTVLSWFLFRATSPNQLSDLCSLALLCILGSSKCVAQEPTLDWTLVSYCYGKWLWSRMILQGKFFTVYFCFSLQASLESSWLLLVSSPCRLPICFIWGLMFIIYDLQEWPICVTYGAMTGYLVGMLASSGFVLANGRRQRLKEDWHAKKDYLPLPRCRNKHAILEIADIHVGDRHWNTFFFFWMDTISQASSFVFWTSIQHV